ncbi:MAG: hypothetical protein WDM94_15220 [Bauldia sp.]
MSADRQPDSAFEKRGRDIRAAAEAVSAERAARDVGPVVGLLLLASLWVAVAGASLWLFRSMEALNAETAQAESRVSDIVNQPVNRLVRMGPVQLVSPGWYPAGAEKPDFDTVDVRKTQEFPYAGYSYVSSDLNPTEMFVGRELEFNAMTKYFYRDRTVPKKRLSEAEMLEINNLYREIGRNQPQSFTLLLASGTLAVLGILLGYGLFLQGRRALDLEPS